MQVLGIGELDLDKSCLLDSYPEEGSKVQPKKVEYSVGGPVVSALILLSRLGAECILIASVGKDNAGEKVKTMLGRERIRFLPHQQKDTKVNTYLVNAENGSRTGIKSEVKHSYIETISQNLIDQADLIVFDRHEPLAFEFVIEHKRAETKVIIDPSTEISAKTMKMFELADYPILPIESLQKIQRHETMMANLQNLYEISRKPVIITAGDKGSLIYDGEKIDFVPAFDIVPIDTLGAGDIFRGAFGYGVLQNWDLVKTVEFANTVAALQCLKIGNSSAIPTRNEIEEFSRNAAKKNLAISDVIN